MRHGVSALAVTVLLTLGGCASAPSPSGTGVEALAPVPVRFEMQGRLAVSDPGRAAQVRVEWRRADGVENLEFLSPLGQVVGRLRIAGHDIVLQTQDGQRYQGDSAATLLEQHLGFAVPVEQLGAWLLARSATGRILSTDAQGRPARLSDAGWLIDYPAYMAADGGMLPRRIEGHWGEARFILLVDTWNLQ